MSSSLTCEGKVGESPAARGSDCWESPRCSCNQHHGNPNSQSWAVLTPQNLPASPKIGAGGLNSHCTDSHHSPQPLDKAKPPRGAFLSCPWQSSEVCTRADSSNKQLGRHQENEGLQEGLQCKNIQVCSREKDPWAVFTQT